MFRRLARLSAPANDKFLAIGNAGWSRLCSKLQEDSVTRTAPILNITL